MFFFWAQLSASSGCGACITSRFYLTSSLSATCTRRYHFLQAVVLVPLPVFCLISVFLSQVCLIRTCSGEKRLCQRSAASICDVLIERMFLTSFMLELSAKTSQRLGDSVYRVHENDSGLNQRCLLDLHIGWISRYSFRSFTSVLSTLLS